MNRVKDNYFNNNLTTRITASEDKQLLKLMKENRCNKSEVVRNLIFNYYLANNETIDFIQPLPLTSNYVQITFGVSLEQLDIINELTYNNLSISKSAIIRILIQKALNDLNERGELNEK